MRARWRCLRDHRSSCPGALPRPRRKGLSLSASHCGRALSICMRGFALRCGDVGRAAGSRADCRQLPASAEKRLKAIASITYTYIRCLVACAQAGRRCIRIALHLHGQAPSRTHIHTHYTSGILRHSSRVCTRICQQQLMPHELLSFHV